MAELQSHFDQICPPQEGEREKHRQALWDYCQAGFGRSLEKLYHQYKDRAKTGLNPPPCIRIQTLKIWSGKYSWERQAQAWDAFLRHWKEAEFLARFNEYRDRMIADSFAMSDRARKLMNWPVATTKVARTEDFTFNGETKQIEVEYVQEPAEWNQRDIALFHREGASLIRQAVPDEVTMADQLRAKGYLVINPHDAAQLNPSPESQSAG